MPVYLDYAASAPLDPAVREVMSARQAQPGNASATHAFGRDCRQAVDGARREVAAFLGCETEEVLFTSGATEANVAAVRSALDIGARAARRSGVRARIIVSTLEHASVSVAAESAAERLGIELVRLPTDSSAHVDAAALVRELTPETVFVAVMWVNNVLGSIQPVAEIGRAVAAERARRGPGGLPLLFHCDAVQAATTIAIDLKETAADTLSVSAHKLGGPQGVGALYLRRGTAWEPLLTGGGQEHGRRSGTENVVGIVGFGEAVRLADVRRKATAQHLEGLRQRLIGGLAGFGGRLALAGPSDGRVPGIVYLVSRRFTGDVLALKLDTLGFAVSSGSACDAGKRKTSPVLTAVLGEKAGRHAGVRVSFGPATSPEDVGALLAALRDCGV